MTLPPDAPWHLTGECVIAAVPGARPGPLPPGICRLPGPAVLVAVAYDTSPVGPYLELAVAEPARAGLRPGLCVTTMVVSSAESRVAGVVNWGFPKELGTLAWLPTGDGVEVCWKERGVVVRAASRARWSVPSAVVLPILQRRSDGSVTVRARVHGRARPARVSVAVEDPDDPLAVLAGRHRGVEISGLRSVVQPARRPATPVPGPVTECRG